MGDRAEVGIGAVDVAAATLPRRAGSWAAKVGKGWRDPANGRAGLTKRLGFAHERAQPGLVGSARSV
ncbi:hypothetical protein ACFOMD_01035 [Sphingoaurantiacus capsulatus]|uniref:Uncharacterized protein n=1 Tax=Sphingoaurantiacus capsulatus TaxID=1771310 RepID=A0ABV7X900_9SPHN